MLDEATSSADAETDRRVQEVIRSEFKDCTILTIAHRLNTIVDSSRVLSMNQGNVAEYDTPKTLFEKVSAPIGRSNLIITMLIFLFFLNTGWIFVPSFMSTSRNRAH